MPKRKPLSLHPLNLEEALKLMLSVPAPKKPASKKQTKSKPALKRDAESGH